jgi:Flp pilus assembly pilin Flp
MTDAAGVTCTCRSQARQRAWDSAAPAPQAVEVSMRTLRERMMLEDGQDLLEYGLLASLIALFTLAAVQTVGQHMDKFFWQAIANSSI